MARELLFCLYFWEDLIFENNEKKNLKIWFASKKRFSSVEIFHLTVILAWLFLCVGIRVLYFLLAGFLGLLAFFFSFTLLSYVWLLDYSFHNIGWSIFFLSITFPGPKFILRRFLVIYEICYVQSLITLVYLFINHPAMSNHQKVIDFLAQKLVTVTQLLSWLSDDLLVALSPS